MGVKFIGYERILKNNLLNIQRLQNLNYYFKILILNNSYNIFVTYKPKCNYCFFFKFSFTTSNT